MFGNTMDVSISKLLLSSVATCIKFQNEYSVTTTKNTYIYCNNLITSEYLFKCVAFGANL